MGLTCTTRIETREDFRDAGDRFEAFWALRPSQEDVAGIFEHINELYPRDEEPKEEEPPTAE